MRQDPYGSTASSCPGLKVHWACGVGFVARGGVCLDGHGSFGGGAVKYEYNNN